MSEPNGTGNKLRLKKKKNVKRPKTKIDRLKLKEAKLRRELKATLSEITDDTKKQRVEQDSLGKVDRQRLANRSTIIRSKLLRLQDEIETRNYVKDDKTSRKIQTKIRDRYANAARKHHRLLRMTAELEKLKEDEETVRVIANDELGMEERLQKSTFRRFDESLVDHRKNLAGVNRISSTRFKHSTKELDEEAEEREDRLEEVRDSLLKLGVETPREKLEKADGLEQKYESIREIRNLTHGQMISRLHKNSYWNIIPPYKRKQKKVEHVRRTYVRNFYEDKVNMNKARDMNVLSPRKDVVEKSKDAEVTRYKLISGRTISLKKIKDLTPPGMDLVSELAPVEC